MGRADVDLLLGFGVDPPAGGAATGERESVRPIPIKDGELKLAIERCGGDRLPLHEKKLEGLFPGIP